MLWRRGEDVTLPPDLVEAVRVYDMAQATHWPLQEIRNTPAPLTERLLLVHRASQHRLSDEQVMDLRAGLIRRRIQSGEQP